MSYFAVGKVRIHRVVEIEGETNPAFLYPEMTPENLLLHEWLRPQFVAESGRPIMAIQALVVESEGRRIIVDTCIGNDKERRVRFWNQLQIPFLERLEAAGFPPQSIDTVLCTHLHVDHVGWNTRLVDGEWLPTFENARYLFGREEWEAWQTTEAARERCEHFGDSVWPVFEHGLVDLVESDHRLTAEVSLEPTPGHSPGHVSVIIESSGDKAVITGDVVHHPAQCAHPEWKCLADWDAAAAAGARSGFCAKYADSPVLIIGSHFATPSAGYIIRDGDVWRFAARRSP